MHTAVHKGNERSTRKNSSSPNGWSTFAKTELVILDYFGPKPLTQAERLDVVELIDDHHGRRSTLVTSQLIAHWHG